MPKTYLGPTPEEDLQRFEREQASTERFFGKKITYNIRHEKAYMATIAVKDPYDATPDAYDYITAYGRTEDEALRSAHARAYDWGNE